MSYEFSVIFQRCEKYFVRWFCIKTEVKDCLKNIKFWQKRYLMVFYNSLKNCAKNSNHNKLEITSRGSPSVMLRLSLLMDSAFVYINCWAHFDGSIEKWRQNLNCYRKPSSTSFARFLSSLSFLAKLFEFHKPVRIVDKQVAFVNFSKFLVYISLLQKFL